jgi:hypothetical protein
MKNLRKSDSRNEKLLLYVHITAISQCKHEQLRHTLEVLPS